MNTNDKVMTSRRKFLAAIPAVASMPLLRAGLKGEDLAVKGGKPVRSTVLNTQCPGTQFYDNQEQGEVSEAVASRSLFRWYGPAKPEKVTKFEQEFAKFLDSKFVLGVTSGTGALHCALTALNVGPGDEVILPAWSWYSSYNAILLTGALPVFAEVDESFNIDPHDVERKITPQTKVIMVVHLMGAPVNMNGINAVARQHNLKVLEDSAQCAGGQYKGRRTGSIGDIGIFSFQIHKLMTAGEGGAVVTNDPLLYERAVRFHDLGLLRPPTKAELGTPAMSGFVGTNYRMNEMTGGVLRAQLRKMETMLAAQRRNCRCVKDGIRSLPGLKMRTSNDPDGDIGITIDLLLPSKEARDQFVAAMAAENVPMAPPTAAVVLPLAPYIENKVTPHAEWPTFKSARGEAMRYGRECSPRTADIFDRAATLTIGPKYTDNDLSDIVAAITKVHQALRS